MLRVGRGRRSGFRRYQGPTGPSGYIPPDPPDNEDQYVTDGYITSGYVEGNE
jgi:hypothetical protein